MNVDVYTLPTAAHQSQASVNGMSVVASRICCTHVIPEGLARAKCYDIVHSLRMVSALQHCRQHDSNIRTSFPFSLYFSELPISFYTSPGRDQVPEWLDAAAERIGR